jgi:CheY-like chemotaxis protein
MEKPAMANILVVDDDIVMQMTIRLLLERAGYSVVVADDGRKGLAAFKTGHFDLVFLDIFMPTMDGLETMKLVRELQPAIPIIAMSGRPLTPDSGSEPDFLAMATKLGAFRTLPKPFKPAVLLATVAACLAATTEPPAQPASDSDVASRR